MGYVAMSLHSAPALLLFVDFIRANPGFAAWLIGGLFSVIGSLAVTYYILIYTRLGHLEERVEKLEDRAGSTDRNVGELKTKIEQHMEMEEERVWPAVDTINESLSEHGERLAHIEEKVSIIEPKDMQDVLMLLKQLVMKNLPG